MAELHRISNQPSTFVNLVLDNTAGLQADDTAVRNFAPQSSRLVLIGQEPLLECLPGKNGHPQLILYGRPGWTNEVQSLAAFDGVSPWQPHLQTILTVMVAAFEILIALMYAGDGWLKVELIPRSRTEKRPDIHISDGATEWNIECKRLVGWSSYSSLSRPRNRNSALSICE